MYDKTVRRRRAVLALLVVLSLILLTAYFGEASSGGLHSVQRGFLTVVSPIQNGANKALKPVRDLVGWFGDTLHAKGQRDELRKQVEKLRAEVISNQAEKHSYRELLTLYRLDNQLSVKDYQPVTATVVAKSPNVWYSTVTIDKGESSGVHVNDPVINGEGLVGKVAQAASDGAQVTLITDSSVGVSARHRHVQRDWHRATEGGGPQRSAAAVPAGQHAGQSRRIRRHVRHRVQPRRLAVPAGHPDRPGDVGQRRKCLPLGQRAPARRPAQPRRRTGADRRARDAAVQSQPSDGQPAAGTACWAVLGRNGSPRPTGGG